MSEALRLPSNTANASAPQMVGNPSVWSERQSQAEGFQLEDSGYVMTSLSLGFLICEVGVLHYRPYEDGGR